MLWHIYFVKAKLHLPSSMSPDLAYLLGFVAGDGHLAFRKKKNGTDYLLRCVGNSKDEKPLYDNVIAPLFYRLFGINVVPKYHDKKKTYGISIWRKDIVYALHNLGIPLGKKSDIIRIPESVKQSDKLLRAFIQGYADADFCLTLKRRGRDYQYYPVIVGASRSSVIIQEIADYLSKNSFRISVQLDRVVYDKRYGSSKISTLQLYGSGQLLKWMEFIGFRNPKNIEKFELWKKVKYGII